MSARKFSSIAGIVHNNIVNLSTPQINDIVGFITRLVPHICPGRVPELIQCVYVMAITSFVVTCILAFTSLW